MKSTSPTQNSMGAYQRKSHGQKMGLSMSSPMKAHACEYTYNSVKSDNEEEKSTETNCGNVYVSGTYSSSLTVGASEDVIINGEIYPYGDKGGEPTGTATLGLIANNFVRIYHPVGETYPVKSQAAKTEKPVGESEVCGKVVELTGKVTSGKAP